LCCPAAGMEQSANACMLAALAVEITNQQQQLSSSTQQQHAAQQRQHQLAQARGGR
jgi:hypothetical protein